MTDEAINKLIEHWRAGAKEEFRAAACLFEKQLYPQTLFHLHLSLEKALKMHVTAVTRDHPPRIHTLPRLADLAHVDSSSEQRQALLVFNEYCMAGRYPGMRNVSADAQLCSAELGRAKDLLTWLLDT